MKPEERKLLEAVEKRIRKDIRLNQRLSTKTEYSILNDNSPEYFLTRHFLERIFNGRLKLKETKKPGKNTIIPTSLDREAENYISEYLTNTQNKSQGIRLLRTVQRSEMKILCKILKIKWTEKSKDFLDDLEAKYPGTKFSVLRTKQFTEMLSNKK